MFAGGEVSSGSSMPFCLVTGALAGRYASRHAHENEMIPLSKAEESYCTEKKKEIQNIVSRSPAEEGNPKDIKRVLKETMMEYAGVLKSKEGLGKALEDVRGIQDERMPLLYARTRRELREALEVINMVTYSEMIIRSALYREESRGLHQRLDFPEQDNKNWLKNILLEKDKGGMRLFDVPVELVWEKPKDS